jgi:nitroimidazol reductase NimA-like FMN-containing flavoprotein (pyridoxamine 5'-phosphate oxidase superfamily)
MHETAQDMTVLQRLLDRSYAEAGEHLRSIHTESRRMSAAELVELLQGMCLLVLATVSADGRPLTGPVDGVFHRGSFYFGTDPTAVRWRNVQRSPAVSATYLPSEDWAVTVHGRAVPVVVSPTDPDGLRATLLEVYLPRDGERWVEFLDSGPVYARIDAERMLALDVTAGPPSF